ncbi:MAG: NusG domain II-containing protein [Anaerovoracaceae bacterium]|jgi:hypothetical protein
MRHVIKKADIVLLVFLILLGLLFSWLSVAGKQSGTRVLVRVNGKDYATYSLAENRTVTIRQNGHVNKFIIKDGTVQMTKSSCKNKLCIEQGRISETNQSIVCLPNRVTLEIQGGESKYDAIAQ